MTATTHNRHSFALALLVASLLALLLLAGCDEAAEEPGGDVSTSSSEGTDAGSGDAASGDIEAGVGETVELGPARVTVNSLQATFQPALPGQRLSEQTPSAPAAGESFYQAYVRVENLAVEPLRVDATHFTCVVENTVLPIEVTRTGPPARSLLKNTSFDLILTFKGQAGSVPELRYSPPWYDGTLRVTPEGEGAGGGTTEATAEK